MPTEPDTNSVSAGDDVDAPDASAVVDALFDHDVVVERPDGTVTTTEAFEHRRAINNDTYLDMDDATFEDVVARAFDLDREEAAARVSDGDVTPGAVSAFFALKGHFEEREDALPPTGTLAAMAEVVNELEPPSPVPGTMTELTNDDYQEFVAETGDAVVFVLKRDCDPCEATKELIPEIQAIAPDGVAFAAVDGEAVPDLVRQFPVEAAPTALVFADGHLEEALRGHQELDTYEETFDAVYE